MSYRKLKRKKKGLPIYIYNSLSLSLSIYIYIYIVIRTTKQKTVFLHQFIQYYVIQSYSAQSGVSSVIIQLLVSVIIQLFLN